MNGYREIGSESPRWRRSTVIAVPAVALLVVVCIVAAVQSSTSSVVELETADSAVLRHEKEGIARAQKTLNKLNAKERLETGLLHKHAVNGKKQAILAEASKTKALASRQVAAALLDTVKQHTAEIAKTKDLARHDKMAKVAQTEQSKATSLSARAAAAKALEAKDDAKAKKLSLKVASKQQQLKLVNHEIDADMAKVEKDKLIAENKRADASAEQHLSDLGVASSKARKQTVEHLHNKIRRLNRKITQLQRKYQTDVDDTQEDTKAAEEYRSETNAARKKRVDAKADIHALKLKEADENRAADRKSRTLETAKELVHERDNTLQHILSREHEAKTALRRAQDRLRDAERRIYHAQMKNEADRDPSDADLGLVHA